MKILYISQYFPPEMGAPAARVSELSRHWAQDGHVVTVLTGFPNHPDGVVRPEYRKHFRRLVYREKLNGVNVVRTWLLPFPNRKPYERILNYGSFLASASMTGSFLNRPDVVIATSPQLLVGLAGWWIARLKRAPLIFEVRDLWPESLAAVGVGNTDSSLHRVLGAIAGFLYRSASRIVVVSPAFSHRLQRHWQVPRQKISVVQNGVETALFKPQYGREIRERLNAEDKFVVSYIGTLGMAHGLGTIIEAAAMMRETAPDVLFLMVGDGADRERLLALSAERYLTNIRILPAQSRGEVPSYIGASDACLVLLKKSDVFETVIPTKMLEFMSCAKPVILGVDGQARQIVESARAGLCVEPESAQGLCAAIRQLQQQPATAEVMGRNGREFILQNYSRAHTAMQYLELLQNLIGKGRLVMRTAA